MEVCRQILQSPVAFFAIKNNQRIQLAKLVNKNNLGTLYAQASVPSCIFIWTPIVRDWERV
jgi:hypothetical protein